MARLHDDAVKALRQSFARAATSRRGGGWIDGQPPSFLHPDRLHPSTCGYGVMGSRLAVALSEGVPDPLAGRSSQAPHSASSAP